VAQVSEPTNSAWPGGVAAGAVDVADAAEMAGALWALEPGGGAANAVAHDMPAQSKTSKNNRSPSCSSGNARLNRRVSGRSVCMKKCMKSTAFEEPGGTDRIDQVKPHPIEFQPNLPTECCASSPSPFFLNEREQICVLLLMCRCRASLLHARLRFRCGEGR
jgi:hypothetical protein